MPIPYWKKLFRKLAWIDKLFLLLLLLYLGSVAFNPAGASKTFLEFLLVVTGIAAILRLATLGIKKAIWRLRNRLLVTYLFIAVVPVVLILILVGIAGYAVTGQVVVYLVTSELERRTSVLRGQAEWLADTAPRGSESLQRMVPYLEQRFQGIEVMVRNSTEWRHPENSTLSSPPKGWQQASGVVLKDQHWYAWAHVIRGKTEATVLEPLTRQYLANLVPGLGEVTILNPSAPPEVEKGAKEGLVPPPANRFDFQVLAGRPFLAAAWESPGKIILTTLGIRSRPSAMLGIVFGWGVDYAQGVLMLFAVVGTMFLIVELISLVIGVNLTRTITRAVHGLYGATQKVREGDFTHRIEVRGNDQLAELCQSFNIMTGNLQRLVVVEKEKERLQSELEIAREVQNQLYPKNVPEMKTLRLKALCQPARVVSGDYFDYLGLGNSSVALAIGDVAGKGISAALLMATVQSSLRTQLRTVQPHVSAAALVAQLNQQLFAYTSPEKYATFYFGLYDDSNGSLTYTNAGHLPPVIVRNGETIRLEVNGTIVGAFPFSRYNESRVELRSGDLLVCYTDGITEPENEYGEMFGEERLLETVRRNARRDEEEIIASILDSVRQWTGPGEVQDDMTLLVARRL